jgi:hypothetical protein
LDIYYEYFIRREISMNDLILAEGIYVKRSTRKLGGGSTARECVMESLWFPYKAENGFVELYPVMDDLQRIMQIMERVPVELFEQEYSIKDDSREIYLELKKALP